jgi:acyl-CoA synthetase (AMP-forming)/AMP-acid ligase II
MATRWQNLSDPLFHHAASRPDRPAIIDGPSMLTYGELAELVGKASVYLRGHDVGVGERVGVNLSSGADHVVLVLALLRVGATLTEIPYSSATPPDRAQLERLGITRMFIESDAPAPDPIASIRVDARWRERVARQSGDYRTSAAAEELQIVTLSSGSTGVPKGVRMTQRLIFDRDAAYEETLAGSDIYAPERLANFLVTASIAYATFLRRLLAQTFAGGPVVLLPEYAHPIDLIKAIAAWDNAAAAVTANMCRAFIACAPPDGPLFPRVRALISVGMPLYPEEKRAIARKVTPNFYDSYGTSGIGTISCLRPPDIEAKAASVGRPVSGVEVEIVDAREAPLPAGATGRLRLRGRTSAHGFLALGALSESEKFADGWYYPGEVGYVDADGFLYLKGRAADLIRRAGIEIFPSEIEEAIATHPGVRAVGIVGVPSESLGEELVAVIVTKDNPPHAEIAQYCRTRLAAGKWPDRIFYAASLPMTVGGKPDRMQLRANVIEQMARRAKEAAFQTNAPGRA